MTSLNSPASLQTLSGSTYSDAILLAVLEDAYLEVSSYLQPYGLSPSGDMCKSAEMKYAQAGLMTRMRLDGTKPSSLSMGGFSSSDNVDQAINGLRKQAEDMLERYVQSQASLANSKRIYCKKVN